MPSEVKCPDCGGDMFALTCPCWDDEHPIKDAPAEGCGCSWCEAKRAGGERGR